jgi:YbbR domain-containing protein
MWSFLFRNLWYKLAALIMAMLLWFHVATDHVYETTRTFPLEIINIPPQLVLSEKIPHQVEVDIRGRGKEHLKFLLSERRSIKIDAKLFKAGETDYLIKPQQIPIPEGLELDVTNIILPQELKIKLDNLMEKKVEVRPRITLLPEKGFIQVGVLHYNPKELMVSGPKKWVTDLKEIYTSPKVLDKLTKPVSDQADLLLPPGYNLRLSTQKINYSADVQKSADRRISDLPVQVIGLPGYREVVLQPDSISVIITSAETLVSRINPDDIKVIVDGTKVKRRETTVLPVQVQLPSDIILKEAIPDSVEVLEK